MPGDFSERANGYTGILTLVRPPILKALMFRGLGSVLLEGGKPGSWRSLYLVNPWAAVKSFVSAISVDDFPRES
jgi:hypothetical protein